MTRRQSVMTLICVGCLLLGLSVFAGADTAGFVSFGSVSAQDVIFAAAGNAGNAAAITAAFDQNGTARLRLCRFHWAVTGPERL